MDRRFLRYLLLFYIISSVYGSIIYILQKKAGLGFSSLTYVHLTIFSILSATFRFAFLWIAILITRRMIQRRISLWPSLLIHLIGTLLITFYSGMFVILYDKYIMDEVSEYTIWEQLEVRFLYANHFYLYLYATAILLVYAYHYVDRQQKQSMLESKLRSQLLDSKINALQSQLQPHFLFNALNDISSLISINTRRAQDAIADLSEMLRSTLGLSGSKYITIAEELSLLEKYINIERLRYSEKLSINITTDSSLSTELIPPLILQPIIENAIKHGYSIDHDRLHIDITIDRAPDDIIITITNNGKLLPSSPAYGTGITNVIERLETLYKDEYQYTMKNEDKKVKTIIQLPIQEPADRRSHRLMQ